MRDYEQCNHQANGFSLLSFLAHCCFRETLGTSETEWVRAMEQKVYGLIKETPPDGEKFAAIIKKTMQVNMGASTANIIF